MLGREVDDDSLDFDEIVEMIEEFQLKLLNELIRKLKSFMNRGSVHPLSIKFSGDRLAALHW
jgi:hypothetical protein